MEFSGNAIKRLGKALRDGAPTSELIAQLEDYRASFDPLLLEMSLKLDSLLRDEGIPHLLTGRSKRTKSILRKLKRPQNIGMDLSRMSDIVGLRILVSNLAHQDQTLGCLTKGLELKDIDDYRFKPPESGYRCIHIIVRNGIKLLEIQLRTLPQHLWAIESESFGEPVKEGRVPPEVGDYLAAVQTGVIQLENGGAPTDEAPPPYLETRKPFTGILPTMVQQFAEAANHRERYHSSKSFLLVYDRLRGQLLHQFTFTADERTKALDDYSMFSKMVDESRFEVLVLNAQSSDGLKVTHPQFF